MKKPQILAGLELGTKAFTLVAGELKESGALAIRAVESVPAQGMERGVLSDAVDCSDAISRLLRQAERTVCAPISSAVAAVHGNHLKSYNATASIPLPSPDLEISRREIEKVIVTCRTLSLDYDRQILHAFERGFSVDGQSGVKDPVGLHGTKLGVELHLVTAQALGLQNLLKVINRAGLDVEEMFLPGLAAAEAVLTELDRDVGVTLISIGESRTEAVLFIEGEARETFLLPWGTQTLADSLSRSLKLPWALADQLLEQIRGLEDRPETAASTLRVRSGSLTRAFPQGQIVTLLNQKVREILSRLRHRLEESAYYRESTAGVVIVGPLARLEGFLEMAENLLNMPVRLGTVREVELIPPAALSSHQMACVGLLRLAALRRRAPRQLLAGPPWLRLVERTRQLLEEYF